MSARKRVKSSLAQRTSQHSNSYQTNLLAWKLKEDLSNSRSTLKHGQNSPVEDSEQADADEQAEDALQIAVRYFEKGKTDGFPYESPISIKSPIF